MSNKQRPIDLTAAVVGGREQIMDDFSGLRMRSAAPPADLVNRPPHYTGHPSGVECIQITEHMNFCRGNALKYLWRAGQKGSELEDLRKARWYIDREIQRLEKAAQQMK